ncbi:Oidioi.mRNA.OKI2018_I69.PAR.g8492.t1.cds [Oikopleura dioica]|uniref:Oidioi.mRNA.OKI2018_I69.PAR.g8492.t1.cds n=1 Tax=Oikopleura dioica TaxID=34765 RepID=A0ABN7RNM2_OIKDI|nr:Oidioi.mRNA.OKI2018_I69.PAR.g8492.t1.cds [Oikopleura dioica]
MKLLKTVIFCAPVFAGIPKCWETEGSGSFSGDFSGDGETEELPGQGDIYDYFKFNEETGKIEFHHDFSAYDGECYLQPSNKELSYLKNNCWNIRFVDPNRPDPIPLDPTDFELDGFSGSITAGFAFVDRDSADNSTSSFCSQASMLMTDEQELIFVMRNSQRHCAPVEFESMELPETCCDFSQFPARRQMNLEDYAWQTCGIDNMKIEIDRCAMVYYGFSIDDLNLDGPEGGTGLGLAAGDDDHCMGEFSEDGDRFVWTLEERDSCRTHREANSTHYTLSNAVSGRTGLQVGKITRIREAKVNFACTYPISLTVSAFNMGYLQTVVPAGIVNLKSTAVQLDYQMAIYKDATYEDFVEADAEFDVPEKIFVGISTTAPGDLKLGVEKCWFTGSPDPADALFYTFIEDGCGETNAEEGSIEIFQNFGSSDARFSVKSFLFDGDESSSLYLHCDVRLCADCDNTCDSDATRKRRELLVLENTDDLVSHLSLEMPIQTRKEQPRFRGFFQRRPFLK